MSAQADRQKSLTDASITVLARDGIHGLTHRRVDTAARVPPGTTSRYFRTRAALLVAVAEAVLERHKEHLHDLAGTLPQNHIGVASALEWLIDDTRGSNRELYVARFELGLEAVRDSHIRTVMNDVRTVSLELTRRHLSTANLNPSDDQLETLASFLTGILFDHITIDRPQADSHTIAHALAQVLTNGTN